VVSAASQLAESRRLRRFEGCEAWQRREFLCARYTDLVQADPEVMKCDACGGIDCIVYVCFSSFGGACF
jgi:hypothetical protein